MVSKISIRKEIQKKRSLLSKEDVEFKSERIANNTIHKLLPKINNSDKRRNIALYLNTGNEVQTSKIIKYLAKYGYNIALPRINLSKNMIVFKEYIPNDALEKNQKYPNILEPEEISKEISPEIIFVPLVACDRNGNRIGMGGGFYDRIIAQIEKNDQNITLIGLAYNFQILDNIKVEEFDKCLDFIVSEDGIIKCNK